MSETLITRYSFSPQPTRGHGLWQTNQQQTWSSPQPKLKHRQLKSRLVQARTSPAESPSTAGNSSATHIYPPIPTYRTTAGTTRSRSWTKGITGSTIQECSFRQFHQPSFRVQVAVLLTATTTLPCPMPEHQEPQLIRNNNDRLWLLQINLNKSERAHLDIINEQLCQEYDVILIQEPHTTVFNATRMPTNFRPVFPAHRLESQDQIRSVIWVSRRLDTNSWAALNIPGTNDIIGIQLKGPYGSLSIFNIYNDCTHSRNKARLRNYIQDNTNLILATDNHHMILAGDFNWHHPLWDRDEDVHLC